ncbi:heme peroxidase [Paracoccus subflavus]|uniref:Heme peroxidase n=1 Tax=Paracoccus subflavus TaxID=2528244 RepID=A0A4Q9G2B1_9RHOB|nr:peroxidase family protein [Paracoccus subflavus]TBN41999.1 heme peroxidase [Paracoccus subflavus]
MATSFHVNRHDLEFILKQIEVAELDAGGMTTTEAIQAVYGVSAADAALMPAGLRTVDGKDNNLLPGTEDNGAVSTPFPRLLDPVYSNEGDEVPFHGVTNTDYGTGGNVVDSDPRTISNLIVDQTPANPAAIYAALKAIGITGTDATSAVNAVSAAYQATLNAKGASAAVTAAEQVLTVETGEHAAALAAHNAATDTLTRYATAEPLAQNAALAADAAAQALTDLIDELAAPSGNETLLYTAAVDAALAAQTAANLVLDALNGLTTPEAQATADAATALLGALDALDGDSVIDATDLPAAQAAADAYAPVTGPSGTASDSVDAITAAHSTAQTTAAGTQTDLDAAQSQLDAAQLAYDAAVATAGTAGTPESAAAFLAQTLEDYGLSGGANGGLVIDHVSPDVGLTAPFNSFMTIFGQFFDHGLDLVNKGGNGTVYIPLQADDPLIAGADQVFDTADDLAPQLRFMALTRATPVVDENGVEQHVNATTSFVDQNQTYTSHASHQVFLREQVRIEVDGQMRAVSTGRLIDGKAATGSLDGAIGNWADVKAQALSVLGIRLQDSDVGRVPLLLTDPYGNLILGDNGYAQMVMEPLTVGGQPWLQEGSAAGITTEGSMESGVAFLVDIAHHAAPGTFDLNRDGIPDGVMTADTDDVTGDDHNPTTYDDEMLDLHIASGDGRGNENIALQSIHSVFHSEHNRIVEENKHTILETGDLAFINEWLLEPITELPTTQAGIDALLWNGDRMFQAARFSTEMQYQHMVFEEFARRIQPGIDPFVFTNSADIDPSIVAEFAHAVYRFGHSMLTDTVDRLGADLLPVNSDAEQMTLIEAFLNPEAFTGSGADLAQAQAAFIRGLTSDVGSEIDEFVVPALRSNLLGLPLDLAALNIARARETGVPSLNEARTQLYNDFALPDLKPYASWTEFTQHLKNPFSIANFIAAYGNHAAIASATTLTDKREAATLLLFGDGTNGDGVTIRGVTYTNADRLDFLNGRGAYGAANDRGGLDNVDLWIGGLAEKVTEFGGMLGTTFGFVFEYQMEQLQNGDRFYYLGRTQGLNMLDALEANTFADIVMRNSALSGDYATHINANLFLTPDMILELDGAIAQRDYNGSDSGRDPVWDDPLLEAIDPKVIRVDSGVTDANGHQVGGELHFRGGEHVVLGGTEGNDRLTSDLGDDALWGDGGNDYLNAGAGADQVFGGDGDDIIEDPFGDNFLRGERGNDVVSSARGINLLFGGQGKDALLVGQDAGEAFGGEGDDFILGSSGPDNLLGNEGNDWIEGGEGFDVIAGENSELFFNSTIVGHDVAWGQGNDQDYDLESGDDIALSGPGVQRFEGMFGFDWASAKYDVAGANWDFNIPIFTSVPAEILRDRFDLMEAMSGWNHNDVMLGDNRGTTAGGLDPNLAFDDHVLTGAGIDRIEGLRTWFDGALETLFGAGATTYRDGNIIMGGAGSDQMMGRGGFDVLDGDAWLNVRIRIRVDGNEYSAESLNSSQAAAGPFAGKVYAVGTDGRPDFSAPAFGGRSLTALLLDRTINPGDMSIVREILKAAPGTARDTAIFAGNVSEYEIEGRGFQIGTSPLIQAAYDVNGDGFISVRDLGGGGRAAFDDTDLIRNIEDLRFADETIAIDRPLGINVNLALNVQSAPTALPANGSVIGQMTAQGVIGTFALAAGSSSSFAMASDGTLSLVLPLGVNQTHQLDVVFTTAGLSRTERLQVVTGSNAVDIFAGSANDDLVYGMGGNDVITGGAGNDVLFGQAGADQLSGGDRRDTLAGGAGNDTVSGGAGDDLILFAWGNGNDAVDGGDGTDRIAITGTLANQTLSATWNGAVLTALTGFTSRVSVEEIYVDLLGSTDTLAYTAASAGVAVDLGAGTASGFTSIANISNANGGGGADVLSGSNVANTLNGGGGNDLLLAQSDDAGDLYVGGAGFDRLDLSAHSADLSVDLSFSVATVAGTGSTTLLSDRVQFVEALILGAGADMVLGSGVANSLAGGDGNDTLSGMNGNDSLDGGGGDDRLEGGAGLDLLTGGLGEDRFVFAAVSHSTVAASDVIADFDLAGAPGGDLIDIGDAAGLPFLFIGTAAFAAGGTNQVRITDNGIDTFVQLDTDTDTGVEAQIRILGLHNLGAADFLL